jgi:hypothetical protein
MKGNLGYKILLILFFGIINIFVVDRVFSEENGEPSFFIFAPMAGSIDNKITYNDPSSGSSRDLNEKSNLYGFDLIYINPKIVLGTAGHLSDSGKTKERGTLLFADYYFDQLKNFQPTPGIAIENISLYSQLSGGDAGGLSSLDVYTDILSYHATMGILAKDVFHDQAVKVDITPFVGYFNERVTTVVSSPGVNMGGQNRYGFKSTAEVDPDYLTLGSKIEVTFYHFIKTDTKIYYRLKKNEAPLYTWRNRIDFLFNRQMGLSAKIDYFKDKYETNLFILVGPVFVF